MNNGFRSFCLLLILSFAVGLIPAPASAATDITAKLTVAASSSYGDSIQLTADLVDLSPGGTVPTGTVTFYDGDHQIGTAPLEATAPTVRNDFPYLPFTYPLPPGNVVRSCGLSNCPVINWGGYDFFPLDYQDNRYTLAVSAYDASGGFKWTRNYSGYRYASGVSIDSTARTFTYTGVQPSGSSLTIPWSDLEMAPARATLSVSPEDYEFTSGAHNLRAVYDGDSEHTGASAEAMHTVNPTQPSVSLSINPQAAAYGETLTLTAEVTGKTGATAPSGTVQFMNRNLELASVPLTDGRSSYTIDGGLLEAQDYSFLAVYQGDDRYISMSSAAIPFTIAQADTVTTLAASANPSTVGDKVTLTAEVVRKQPVSNPVQPVPSPALPTGSVTFKKDGVALADPVQLNAEGKAILTTSFASAGTAVLTADYVGDFNDKPSVSSELIHRVDPRSIPSPPVIAPIETPAASPLPTAPSAPSDQSVMLINGVVVPSFVASVKTETVDGRTRTTYRLDAAKLKAALDRAGRTALVTFKANSSSDAVIVALDGASWQAMRQNGASLDFVAANASYRIPSDLSDPARWLSSFAASSPSASASASNAESVGLELEIARPSATMVEAARQAVQTASASLLAEPRDFTLRAVYNGQTTEVSTFDRYVTRSLELPANVSGNAVTTAAALEPDGTLRPVPTRLRTNESGQTYADISSRSNSVYILLGGNRTFSDLSNSWARSSVENLASKLIVDGTGGTKFEPSRVVTRAEFSAMLVRALGLKLNSDAGRFKDVAASDWYAPAAETAAAAGILSGYSDGRFHPMEAVTREQAAVMLAQLQDALELNLPLTASAEWNTFADADQVSAWAATSIQRMVASGLMHGTSGSMLQPNRELRRDEAAALIERLLQSSGLITSN